ncbi:NAD(P)-binding Rossmann-fold superfamily protein [Rhynchospora pubera]|uniref:NAD(P)-binding Rossmann-fold superfamily protein n=1 Tax=Rhynchospora pubera TaxID=906938 RepID=A0AAV8DGP2_9POAL|nr:NAD(P)-binding Rossmann-fold superfamily protein [Rhynchospora pubera]
MARTSVTSVSERRLEGKVALITGGASGIGEATTRLFIKHGAKVCIADIRDDLGRRLLESLGSGTNARFIHCDVSKEDGISKAVDFTAETFGTIDILVNNAGIIGNKVPDIREVDLHELQKVFEINVDGVFLGMKHAARIMIPRGKGSIISTASTASTIGGLGPHGYTSSKHAVVGLTESVAAELGKHGIRVNCVSPYGVPTGLTLPLLPAWWGTGLVMKFFYAVAGFMANLKGVNLEASDVAEAMLFLASDEARYVRGLNLTVDGGLTVVNGQVKLVTGVLNWMGIDV